MTAPAAEATPGQGDVVDPAVTEASPTDPPKAEARTPEEEAAHWKKMSRQHEDSAKALKKQAETNAAAAAELETIKEAQKSAEQKAQEAAEKQARDLAETQAENVRLRMQGRYGLSDETVRLGLLGTGTDEEVEARAKHLGALEAAFGELAEINALVEEAEALEAQRPGAVPILAPGGGSAPDRSYPTGWFPQLRPKNNSN